MDKGLRNTLIGICATMIAALAGEWVMINNRISVLEVQVQNNRALMLQNEENISSIRDGVNDIKIGIQHLQDIKEDKK